jgi:hypothetical protein
MIPCGAFRTLVDKFKSDNKCKGFAKTIPHLRKGYRNFSLARLPTKSTISYYNKRRSWELFKEAFELVMSEIRRRLSSGGRSFTFEKSFFLLIHPP